MSKQGGGEGRFNFTDRILEVFWNFWNFWNLTTIVCGSDAGLPIITTSYHEPPSHVIAFCRIYEPILNYTESKYHRLLLKGI
jgi:hypothetical protein